MLTTTGSFETDAQGYLTTPSGLVLLGWPADANGVVASQPRDTVNGLQPVRVNMSSVAVEPTSEIALNVNLPTDDVEAGASGDPRVVTIEYFDNVGGAQTLTATFAPTVPAVGNPRSNTWTLTLTDQASGQSAGSYELVFSDAPPNAGGLASVTALGGGTLATTYDPVTGEMMLDLGTQQIGFGVGSTGTTGPQHLSQLTSTFSSVGVSHDGSGAGTYTGLSIDEKGFLYATYSSGFSKVIYQIPVADVPNPNGLKVLDNQCFAHLAGLGRHVPLERRRRADGLDRGLRPRAVDHRHRQRADAADPDPARLFVERQDHPDGRRDAAGNHQPQALRRWLTGGAPHGHLERAEQRRLRPGRLVTAGRHRRQQRGERDDAGFMPGGRPSSPR